MQKILLVFLAIFAIVLFSSETPIVPENLTEETSIRGHLNTPKNEVVKATTTPKPTSSGEVGTEASKPNVTIVAKKTETPVQVVIQKPPEPPPDFEKINAFAREAIVNILCETKSSQFSPISGTGVVISPDGVILTNAHIGQYLLLKDYTQKDFVSCVIRTGSPAYPRYKTELIYISPTWIENNSSVITQTDPQGTGENDFAILRITETIGGQKPELPLLYLAINATEVINENEPVILISYPAGFLGGLSIIQGLNITSSITLIKEVFTFRENTIDLLDVGGTILSQKGSSGGAVVDKNSKIIGLIVTSSIAPTTAERELRAITMAHINRSLKSQLGILISNFLSIDLAEFAQSFNQTTAPLLTKIITTQLEK